MKYIKRKSAVKPMSGLIVDTINIDDKTTNTYSARVIDEKTDGITGTWIPELTCLNENAPTITYTYQRGTYIKTGNMVFLKFAIRGKITALNGTNNYATINLPFEADVKDGIYVSLVVSSMYDLLTSDTNAMLKITNDHIKIQTNYGAYAGVYKVTSKNYFDISASGWYKILET